MKDNKKGFRKRFADLAGKKRFKMFSAILVVLILAGSIITFKTIAEAEQSGGSPNNNPAVSYIKQLHNELSDLTYGSDVDTPNWGTYWNRIKSAAKWTPSGNTQPSDVKTGKTFYSTTRGQQTGAYPAPGPCSTQQYSNGYASQSDISKIVNNCVLSWEIATPAVPGDDPGSKTHNPTPGNKDPRTGLVWSQLLKNNGGTNDFTTSAGSTYSWNDSATNNAGRTAEQLCLDQGNGWRLPTQIELMQAYIDGAYFNLTNILDNSAVWSVSEVNAGSAWIMYLGSGSTYSGTSKSSVSNVRCVR